MVVINTGPETPKHKEEKQRKELGSCVIITRNNIEKLLKEKQLRFMLCCVFGIFLSCYVHRRKKMRKIKI